jgi:ribosomal protein S3AE
MNAIQQDIIKRHKVSPEQANEIRNVMDRYIAPDYSECTMRELNRAIDDAHTIWSVGADAFFGTRA